MKSRQLIEDEVDDRLGAAVSETRYALLEVTETRFLEIRVPIVATNAELCKIIRRTALSDQLEEADSDVVSAYLYDEDDNELASVDW